ncbi:MAG: cysteine-rich CWC family protein [Bacteroidales bacterium]|nr:cysteine-rich CWC family protein [Bacteroidales bacterium]
MISNSSDKNVTKVCSNCNEHFICCTEDDCWCENYAITKGNMYLILQNFADCICPECLKKYSI